jgi:hypothetical protein
MFGRVTMLHFNGLISQEPGIIAKPIGKSDTYTH